MMYRCLRNAFSLLTKLNPKFSICANIHTNVNTPVLLGNSTIGRLVGLSALVDTDPRDFAYALMLDEGPLALLTTCGAADLGWVAITGL